MNFTTYIRRTAKYALYLCVVLVVIFTLMHSLGQTPQPIFYMLLTKRGLYMAAVIVAFAMTYPFMGYTKKSLTCNAQQRKEDVARVMTMCGYKLVKEEGDTLVFRASGTMKKLMLMFEDEIVVKTENGFSTMSGPRKEVVKASFRITTYVL